jgi:hypothetical protein
MDRRQPAQQPLAQREPVQPAVAPEPASVSLARRALRGQQPAAEQRDRPSPASAPGEVSRRPWVVALLLARAQRARVVFAAGQAVEWLAPRAAQRVGPAQRLWAAVLLPALAQARVQQPARQPQREAIRQHNPGERPDRSHRLAADTCRSICGERPTRIGTLKPYRS